MTPRPASPPQRLIRHADRGEAVRDVQGRLVRLGYASVGPDGAFGTPTLQAVRAFQRDRGLAADGIVGPETWRALTEAGYTLGDRVLWHASSPMRGDDVRELQHRLNRLGFDAGPEDGIFGPLARAAVEEFQRNVGLAVDGLCGPATVEALRRLHRGHQSGGLGVRARQREALRQLAGRGIVGARILLDPARGGDDPGRVGPSGTVEADVTWEIVRRLEGRLGARGASVALTRGPRNGPSPTERATTANVLDVDLVLSVATNAHSTPVAEGSATYYFGSSSFVSEPGMLLARRVSDELAADGWTPDCGRHPMRWSLLRETRMPTVVVEPGFLTSPRDEAALTDPARQDSLAAALARAIQRFLAAPQGTTPPAPAVHTWPARRVEPVDRAS